MHERDVELFNDSLERCSLKPEFLRRFYTLFLASSPEVAKKFEHTDMRKQVGILRTSLYILMLSSDATERIAHLQRIAATHSRSGYDIKPEFYDLWLDRMLQTVREHDPQFDVETEAAWRNMLLPGIEYMKSRY